MTVKSRNLRGTGTPCAEHQTHRDIVTPHLHCCAYLQACWAEGIAKNQEIDRACQELELQIKEAREKQAAAVTKAASDEVASSSLSATVTVASMPSPEADQTTMQDRASRNITMADAAVLEPPVAAEGESGQSPGADVLRENGANAAAPQVRFMLMLGASTH